MSPMHVEFGAGEFLLLFPTVLTVLVVAVLLYKHCHNLVRPGLQPLYMRMILLPAVFAVLSYVAFAVPFIGVFIEAVRGLSEAYALYAFFAAMVVYAGGQEKVSLMYEQRRWAEEFKHSCFCGLYTWRHTCGRQVYAYHRKCVLQLLILKPVFTLVIAFSALLGDAEHDDNIKTIIILFALGNFTAMMVLMRTLYVVYQVAQDFLNGMQPGIKFAVVKLMVFVTVTQQFVVNMLISGGSISAPDDSPYNTEQVGTRLLNALGVCEMFLFSLAYLWAFSAQDPSLYRQSPTAVAHGRPRSSSAATEGDIAIAIAQPEADGTITATAAAAKAGAGAGAEGGKPVYTPPPSSAFATTADDGLLSGRTAPQLEPYAAFARLFRLSDILSRKLEEQELAA